MAQTAPIRRDTPGPEIPDKLYFRIGDVAKLCAVPAYVLRFWETEFPQLKPNKGGTGQRLYRRRDVEMAMRIKRLLYDEGYTIPGARQVFRGEQHDGPEPQLALAMEPVTGVGASERRRRQQVQKLRMEMEELHGILSRPPAAGAQVRAIRAARAPSRLSLAPATGNAAAGNAAAGSGAAGSVAAMDDLFGADPA